jgi:branched-chain amino acid aminotransferase
MTNHANNSLQIDPEIHHCLDRFKPPAELGFGSTMIPIMYQATFNGTEWVDRQLVPYGPLSLDPAAKVLHYAQEVFEGLKAYRVGDTEPNLFRPKQNWKRMNDSAHHLCMPLVPEAIFMEGIESITAFSEPFIPRESGCALYLRPFMIGVDANLGLAASNEYLFTVIASPSAGYQPGAMRVKIDNLNSRAAVGGTGHVKVGGNYAAAMKSSQCTTAQGFHQTLWLDPVNREYLEELSGMNIFALIDGELHTPELSGTILPGITRDSIIQLARRLGIPVIERRISVTELLKDIDSGRCTEMLACGTAAIIVPIGAIGVGALGNGAIGIEAIGCDGSIVHDFSAKTTVSNQLREALLSIQEARAPDPFGWCCSVPCSSDFYQQDKSLQQ